MSENLHLILREIAAFMETPVVAVLILLIAASVVLLGSLLAELFSERRHLKVSMPKLIDDLRDPGRDPEQTILESGLLRRQKKALTELLHHPELTEQMREALAERLLEEEQSRYAGIVKYSDLISKLGPMFGLLGTLIPLGPGIIALGEGDAYTLSQSLLTAFDTTTAGLLAAAASLLVSTVRKGWYANYMSILESLTDCVLETALRQAGSGGKKSEAALRDGGTGE